MIDRRLGLEAVGTSADRAAAHFGWFAHFAALDNPATGEHTQALLGWRPAQVGWLAELDRAAYFAL